MRILAFALALIWPLTLHAADYGGKIGAVIDLHILPGFERLADATGALAGVAEADCSPESNALRDAFNLSFDAWMGVSHLRFGPTEADNRAFALAFWPDTKGFTPRTLADLIEADDPAVYTPEEFAHVSIAGRGFYALEFMLYDEAIAQVGTADRRCALIRAIAVDIDATAEAILADWRGGYADLMRNPGEASPYRSGEEAVQEVFKALTAGLEFTADTRLGRPMGSFDKPRPTRAEAWRSGRSLRNLRLSLEALQDLADLLSQDHPEIEAAVADSFGHALALTEALDDLAFAGVADPQGRFRLEILQQAIGQIRQVAATRLGPTLGVSAGFNALDGD